MILIDTGPLVALFDKSDNYHSTCHAALKTVSSPLFTTTPVLTEALYLLNFSWDVQDDLWEFITGSDLQVYDLHSGTLKAKTFSARLEIVNMKKILDNIT